MLRLKSINILTFILLLNLFLTGCQKESTNGELDGQWQIISVSPAVTDPVISGNLYMNFYRSVCQLSFYDDAFAPGTLEYNGSSLTLHFPYNDLNEVGDAFKEYGIYSNPVTFDVSFPSKHKMILKNQEATVYLRKY